MSGSLPILLTPLVKTLEDDIRAHATETDELNTYLRQEHQRAKDAQRTAHEFTTWRDEQITLSAVAWVLGCVFVRFCEDNDLIAEARLAGPGDRLAYAEDETTNYFSEHPADSDREYLLWVFAETSKLPGMGDLFDPTHNPLYKLPPSVDGAKALLSFWRRLDGDTGELALSFVEPTRDTRFLGDLYQDLSEDAKKRYALLQTPHFIESFILERTLEPAIREFGLANTDLIDPACGSGHFLLGAFERLLGHWQEKEPQTNTRALCQRIFDQIAGVDINPFAVAIARFRLLIAALSASEVTRLADAPDFKLTLATGDSLLHGQRPDRIPGTERASARPEHQHLYDAEDEQLLRKILDHRYAAVVANPPYITPKDPAARDAYRDIYPSCKGKYALSVPFMERLFDLARPSDGRTPAGFIGQITSNSFMKREFGKKLIEEYLPGWDLTHLVDTTYLAILDHNTPTVILFARAQSPQAETVRGILGIRGEPGAPDDPARGEVWREIVEFADLPGVESEFVSCEELDRERLSQHPWSLQGGGASEIKTAVEAGHPQLGEFVQSVGITAVTGEDDLFLIGNAGRRVGVEDLRPLVEGDRVRDWAPVCGTDAVWPYSEELDVLPITEIPHTLHFMWSARRAISSRRRFGTPMLERGLTWWEWQELYRDKLQIPLSITFAFVSTHNHFIFDRGGKVFKQTAPVIKLESSADEEEHIALLGPLNSSIFAFWARQTFQPKQGANAEAWENRLEHDSTKLQRFPLPKDPPTELARRLDALGQHLSSVLPSSLLEGEDPAPELLENAKADWQQTRRQMIALQEELDWRCYRLYGLIDDDLVFDDWDELPEVALGERVFEIALARRVDAGETETRWFERHNSTPITEIPDHFPEPYRELMQRRLDAIEANKSIRLIERPEYKRRWQTDGWESMEQAALRDWIATRLESDELWSEPKLLRADQISDELLADTAFQEALMLYGGADAEGAKLVARIVKEEAVPYLATLRYTEAGMRKREAWEHTWDLQRAEDRGEKVEIDVPPKYKKSDFRGGSFWSHRGKLDVPKERFISYPGAAPGGGDLYGWAGWDHLQRSQALATQITEAQDKQGASDQLISQMLSGLEELLPWIKQWHPEVDPQYGSAHGDIYESFLEERARKLGVGRGELVPGS